MKIIFLMGAQKKQMLSAFYAVITRLKVRLKIFKKGIVLEFICNSVFAVKLLKEGTGSFIQLVQFLQFVVFKNPKMLFEFIKTGIKRTVIKWPGYSNEIINDKVPGMKTEFRI